MINIYNSEEKEEIKESSEEKENLFQKKREELFLKKRRVFLWGVVEDKTIEKTINQILLLDGIDPGKEIELIVNSPGGSVTAGLALMDVIDAISSPINTVCMGLAASMGSMILSAGQKGKRSIFKNAEVMIHQPSIGGIQGQAIELEITAKQILKTRTLLAQILSDNTGQPIEKILKDFDRDFWLDANEALSYGIVDNIITKI